MRSSNLIFKIVVLMLQQTSEEILMHGRYDSKVKYVGFGRMSKHFDSKYSLGIYMHNFVFFNKIQISQASLVIVNHFLGKNTKVLRRIYCGFFFTFFFNSTFSLNFAKTIMFPRVWWEIIFAVFQIKVKGNCTVTLPYVQENLIIFCWKGSMWGCVMPLRKEAAFWQC